MSHIPLDLYQFLCRFSRFFPFPFLSWAFRFPWWCRTIPSGLISHACSLSRLYSSSCVLCFRFNIRCFVTLRTSIPVLNSSLKISGLSVRWQYTSALFFFYSWSSKSALSTLLQQLFFSLLKVQKTFLALIFITFSLINSLFLFFKLISSNALTDNYTSPCKIALFFRLILNRWTWVVVNAKVNSLQNSNFQTNVSFFDWIWCLRWGWKSSANTWVDASHRCSVWGMSFNLGRGRCLNGCWNWFW